MKKTRMQKEWKEFNKAYTEYKKGLLPYKIKSILEVSALVLGLCFIAGITIVTMDSVPNFAEELANLIK